MCKTLVKVLISLFFPSMSLSKPRGTPMEEGPSCSRKKRETCTHQRQEYIINVAAVIRQEMMDDFDSFNVAEKTARYLKLSVNTVRRWSKNVDHCERLIKEDWDREMKMDASETHPPIIINLAEDDVDEVLATPTIQQIPGQEAEYTRNCYALVKEYLAPSWTKVPFPYWFWRQENHKREPGSKKVPRSRRVSYD
uniref:RWP-RK domain-containing protein n=1 Tax=Timema poppense TaxID=170557 RepID=A0A7R9CZ36_TIMPO|nr:unnamed protein product [Timema poppensis]